MTIRIIVGFARKEIPQYQLNDYSEEIILGTFYQIQQNNVHEQKTHLVERVLRQRKIKGKNEYPVKWKVWDP